MRSVSRVFSHVAERYLPDAFIFVFVLTLIVYGLGMLKGYSPVAVLDYWGDGFFNILTFTAQATLMLVTGFALAHTPPIHKGLRAFAKIPKNEVQVIIVTTLVMMVCSWLSWGFGLIAGAIVAREMGIVHHGKVHYPLVVAASYAGFLVWHAGYGGAIPTLIATPGHFLEERIGVIPVTETIFSSTTLILVAVLAVVVPAAMVLMRPKSDEPRKSLPESELKFEQEEFSDQLEATAASGNLTPAARMEESRIVTFVMGLIGALWLASYFLSGGALNLNTVILSFFAAGLLFGIGLLLSGMANPEKVLAFLDVFGRWDPSLALVMIGAIAIGLPLFALARRHPHSVLGAPIALPSRRDIDRRLVLGSLTFGIGWGLAGFCPGPGVVALGSLQPGAVVFVGAMLAGMGLFHGIEQRKRRAA